MKSANKVLLITVLGVATAFQARANQEYDWTGGAAGYSGTIILDSNSNSAGTIADIVSATITTPQGTYVFDRTQVYSSDELLFAWNPSQITDMLIDWYSSAPLTGFGENFGGTGRNFVASETADTVYIDFSGSWTAASSVPDASSTVALLGAALLGLAALRRRFVK